MIFECSPINPEIAEVIHRSSSYTNKEGQHPPLESGLSASQIQPKGSDLKENEWELTVEDPNIYAKMMHQINTMKIYKDSIWISR